MSAWNRNNQQRQRSFKLDRKVPLGRMSWRAAQLIPLSTPGPPRRARVWRRIGGYIPAARYDRIWRRTRHPIHQAAVQTVPTDQPNGRLIATGDGIDVRTRSSKACSKPFWRAIHHRGLTQRKSNNPGESMPGVRPNRANANLRCRHRPPASPCHIVKSGRHFGIAYLPRQYQVVQAHSHRM